MGNDIHHSAEIRSAAEGAAETILANLGILAASIATQISLAEQRRPFHPVQAQSAHTPQNQSLDASVDPDRSEPDSETYQSPDVEQECRFVVLFLQKFGKQTPRES